VEKRISEIVASLHEVGEGETVSFGEILAVLGRRAHGAAMLVFALPCWLPMPPGIPTACGAAILLISLQLLAGRETLWLPRRLRDRRLPRAALARIAERIGPTVSRAERFFRPRLPGIAEGPVGQAITGVLGAVLGLTMILPIPFVGNIPPAIAASFLAIGLIERDGVALLVALALAFLAAALVALLWWGVVNGLN
jgi:hypothetical protein